MINKSASKAAEICFANGNRVVLWVGSNRNTGSLIVWQVVWRNGKPGRSTRVTGRNIGKLANEIRDLPAAEGRVVWSNAATFTLIVEAV